MPKGFTTREKEIIREKLVAAGKTFLEKYGLRKTNIEDLTQAAGISKGAFYLFFDSKEELFLEVLEQVEADFRANLFNAVYQPGKSSRENFKDLLRNALLSWDTYPVLRNFSQADFEYLVRKLPAEKIQVHTLNDDAFVAGFIEKWEREGRLIEADPKQVSGLMKALFFVALHKDDLGQETYPDTMDLLIGLITNYLIEETQ